MASRAGWSNRVTDPSRTGWAVCLSPSACTSFQGQAGPWHPRSGRSQKSATCTYTCSSHVSNMLTCAQPSVIQNAHTLRTHTVHYSCTLCVHTCSKALIHTLVYAHSYAHTHPFPEAHTAYLQPQETAITGLGLPKATQGAECKPACSHTHGHLLKTSADPESHNS